MGLRRYFKATTSHIIGYFHGLRCILLWQHRPSTKYTNLLGGCVNAIPAIPLDKFFKMFQKKMKIFPEVLKVLLIIVSLRPLAAASISITHLEILLAMLIFVSIYM